MVKSKIPWTQYTWSPWRGCTPVSEGCEHCYAYRDMNRYGMNPRDVVKCSGDTWAKAYKYPPGSKVFVCPWSDFFHVKADCWREEALEVMSERKDVTWLLLTKRPERVKHVIPDVWWYGNHHVWLGATTENEEEYNKRVDHIILSKAQNIFISVEPMLGPIIIKDVDSKNIDWVICGCESGPQMRITKHDWIKKLKDQCVFHNIPFFLKQRNDGILGKLEKMPKLDGKVWDQVPWGEYKQ